MVSHRTAELSRGQSAASGPASPASSRSDSMYFLFSTTSCFGHMAAESNNDKGSKAASTPDGIDFRFLNFSHPQEAKNAQTRRNVRSHVTTKQHEKHRQRVAEQARQTQQDSRQPSPTSSVHISRTSSGNSPAQSLSEPETSSPEASSSPSSPTGATGPTRINPLQIYPEAWHGSLRPVMVSLRKHCVARHISDLSLGPLLQLHGRGSTWHRRSNKTGYQDALYGLGAYRPCTFTRSYALGFCALCQAAR